MTKALQSKSKILNKHNDTALTLAVKDGNLKDVKKFCTNENINEGNKYNHTPLMIAIHNNHIDILSFLIKKKADLKLSDTNGRTALMSAIRNYQLNKKNEREVAKESKIIEKLIENKENNFDIFSDKDRIGVGDFLIGLYVHQCLADVEFLKQFRQITNIPLIKALPEVLQDLIKEFTVGEALKSIVEKINLKDMSINTREEKRISEIIPDVDIKENNMKQTTKLILDIVQDIVKYQGYTTKDPSPSPSKAGSDRAKNQPEHCIVS